MQAKPLDTQDKRTSEIAAAVQAGKADILSLWAAVERFAWQQTLRWVRAMEGRAGVEESDLLQVAFIALMDTLPTWDVNKGEFLTLYGIKLKAEFTEAFEDIEQRDFRQVVQAALAQLTDAQRDAIISEFWLGQKPDAKARREAIRALRHPRIRKPLMEYY